jgi:hypothetical protein
MAPNLYKNSISFDFIQKFNIMSSNHLILDPMFSVNINDKRLELNLLRAVSLYVLQLNLVKTYPKVSRLKKAVSNFKTRGGELHGVNSKTPQKKAVELMVDLCSCFFVDVAELNPHIRFGLAGSNSISFGFEDIKNFGVFAQQEAEYLTYKIGATFSFSVKLSAQIDFLVFISAFVVQRKT